MHHNGLHNLSTMFIAVTATGGDGWGSPMPVQKRRTDDRGLRGPRDAVNRRGALPQRPGSAMAVTSPSRLEPGIFAEKWTRPTRQNGYTEKWGDEVRPRPASSLALTAPKNHSNNTRIEYDVLDKIIRRTCPTASQGNISTGSPPRNPNLEPGVYRNARAERERWGDDGRPRPASSLALTSSKDRSNVESCINYDVLDEIIRRTCSAASLGDISMGSPPRNPNLEPGVYRDEWAERDRRASDCDVTPPRPKSVLGCRRPINGIYHDQSSPGK